MNRRSLLILLLSLTLQAEYPENFVEDGIIIKDLTTEESLELVKPFLPENPFILEAGCHGGQDTILLGNMWPRGHVFAFEPVLKFVGFTKFELKKHKVPNASVFPFALAETTGNQPFYYSKHIGAASSLLKSNDAMDSLCNYQDIKITVNSINIDDWAKRYRVDHIDFMWLDIEGSEYYVLKAAPNILKTVTAIITEINFREFRVGSTQYKQLYDFLIENDFKLLKIWGNPTWQANALFVRNSCIQ